MVIGRVYKIITTQGNECYIGSTFNTTRNRFTQHKSDYKKWKNNKSGFVKSYELFEKYGIENCRMILIKEYDVCDKKHLEIYETLWINKLKSINEIIPFSISKLSRKKYYKDNKEKILIKSKQYREEHKEELSLYFKNYREENKEELKKYKKDHYEDNKEKILIKSKQYREEHKEELSLYFKNYREENKEKIKKYQKDHYEEHKEEIDNYKKKWYFSNKNRIIEKNKKYKEEHRKEISERHKQKITCECGSVITICNKLRHERSQKHQDFINKN